MPPFEKPLRIQIEGPLVSLEKLMPGILWPVESFNTKFPLPAGPKLAEAAFKTLYGRNPSEDVNRDLVIRDEYLGWVMLERGWPINEIDYYGVTFDHLVPIGDDDPDVLQLNIIEMDNDNGAYANDALPFTVNPGEYIDQKVLAVPRCCQKRKGSQDRFRINQSVRDRDARY